MTAAPIDTERASLDDAGLRDVARQVLRLRGIATERYGMHTWIPAGARKSRRRLFVRIDIGDRPVGVAKVPLSDADAKVGFEFDVLTALGEVGFDRPVPLGRIGTDGFAMTYVDGVDLPAAPGLTDSAGSCWRVLRPAVLAVAALHTMAPDPAAPELTAVEAAAQYVREPLFGVAHADAALRVALLARTHGDLGPWNMRYEPESGGVRILDFEDYRPAGVAGMDIVNLLVTCALVVFPDYPQRGFDWLYERVFSDAHWFREVLGRGLRLYAARTGVRPSAVADLLPLTCQWLIERIEAEGRDTSGMFYRPFADRYLDHRPTWVRSLDD
ncbi:phosphotransferase [Actinoplanes sp. N902-109]|uniref:phosphotransferase n=1 Tax=Actinoplanes sp. (strain N902-109) TaxID=649831 RepID=UPI0003294483|nr:phosphotransferase [Actinoplanes sp. N902-109]AGL15000.1 hypothetical protein L083_1490 [Actinoplanes sp. N902-109]